MKKMLYIENVASIDALNFYKSAAIAAQNLGLEFHLAYNAQDRNEEKINSLKENYGVHFHQVDFIRAPYNPKNYKAYKQVCRLINDFSIDYIHCNTPIGGVIGRLAGSKCKVKKIIYQAHGFHFYKNAPIRNWIIYYPIEKLLAKKTDVLITINKEDYQLANKKLKLRNNGKIYYVPGVGIDLESYQIKKIKSEKLRQKFNLKLNDFIILVVGRLEKNKNCQTIIKAFKKANLQNSKLIFCGDGEEKDRLIKLSKQLEIQDKILFLGNRKDVNEIYHMVDCFVLASFREGLSRSIMEAMASGLPCIVSNIRGNEDLIVKKKGGYLFECDDVNKLAEHLTELASDIELRKRMSLFNLKIINNFDISRVVKKTETIYKKYFI